MSNVSLFENDVIPIVQEKKKYQNFTVREIGGPAEIIVWRAEQARKELANQAFRMQVVEAQKTKMIDPTLEDKGVTWKGSAGTQPRMGSWADKLAEGKEMRKDYMKPELLTKEAWTYEPYVEPKKTFFQRIKGAIRAFWDSAKF
jgi:hypothetical protein